ncbi:MAG: M16 family metallopeptidase [Planctomycetota bacterium]
MSGIIIERGGGLPVAKVRWIVPSGSVQDPRASEGLTSCAWLSTTRGGRTWSRAQLASQWGGICRGLVLRAHDFDAEMRADVPLDRLTSFAKQWRAVIDDCDPPPQELELLIRDLRGDFALDFEQPESRAAALCRRVLWSGDPMGNFPDGSPASLKGLHGDVMARRRKELHGCGGLLGIAGDVPDETLAVLQQEMGVPERHPDFFSMARGIAPQGHRLGLWHDATQEQASVSLQWSTGRPEAGELMNLRLAEMLLCSEFSSVLSTEFRQRSGLTYGIHGSHRLHPGGGVFQLRFSTDGAIGPRMLGEVLGALDAFARHLGSFKITDRSGLQRVAQIPWEGQILEDCRLKALNSLPFLVATESDRVARRMEQLQFGTMGTDIEKRARLLKEATPESVVRAAQWLFERQNMAVAVVDNLAERKAGYLALEQWSVVHEDGASLCGLN